MNDNIDNNYFLSNNYAGNCPTSGQAMTLLSNKTDSACLIYIIKKENGGKDSKNNLFTGCQNCKTQLENFNCSIINKDLKEPRTLKEKNAMIREMRMYIQAKRGIF